jgi:hypothetical protein
MTTVSAVTSALQLPHKLKLTANDELCRIGFILSQ